MKNAGDLELYVFRLGVAALLVPFRVGDPCQNFELLR